MSEKRINWKRKYDELKTKYSSACAKLGVANRKNNSAPKLPDSPKKIKGVFWTQKNVDQFNNMLTTDEVQALKEQCQDNYARWQDAENRIEELVNKNNILKGVNNNLINALFYLK